MAKKKHLNIGNSSRYYNAHLLMRNDIDDKIKVSKLNEKNIEENLDILKDKSKRVPLKDGKDYMVYQERFSNDTLIQKIINHGGSVTYYTNSIIPYHVVKQMSMNLNSEVIYKIRGQFTPEEQENVELSFMATHVIIDVPVVIPDMNPYDLLFSLHDLKTNVDKVHFSFPPLHESEMTDERRQYYEYKNDKYYIKPIYKFEFFKYIQKSLSIWKMLVVLICENQEDYNSMKALLDKDQNKRSPSRKKSEAKS